MNKLNTEQKEALEALKTHLKLFDSYLDDKEVQEIAINRLGELMLWKNGQWIPEKVEGITYDYLDLIGRALSNFCNKPYDRENTSLSGYFPEGERLEMTHPPTAPEGLHYLNLRKSTGPAFKHEDLTKQGYYENVRHEYAISMTEEERSLYSKHLTDDEKHLWKLAKENKWEEFIQYAVPTYQNIVVSGATGSGKTAYCRSLIEMIDVDDRIITVEDTPEMPLPNHPNNNRLLYKKDPNSKEGATAKDVLHSVMRKTPKRVLLAELRGDETLYYLSGVLNSGHPGGITTTHANTPTAAFSRLALLILMSEGGKSLDMETIMRLLKMTVNVVVQIEFVSDIAKRRVTAIYYDPMQRLALIS
ncbi:Type IV secretion system protein VirB11 (plasmid) [Janthinobacterium sp. HH102]|uniref:P-type DNA transfer ATPase VirB11 n=1 Tax=Janthinobacterium sp. HH102 TaxID=1537274 RepID=UPI000893303D|nr:P-type DNA transfer ATPase VirB11 [Janthinobacterium sp. HH102]QOU76435.1 Type IV secretion system protein VirB11 [Janthinobacterium sp. HH102]